MFEGVTLRLDSSLQLCLSFNAFHAIPAIAFGENQYTAIAYESLVFTLEFEEAFNLSFSILRGYDLSTLAYHCIPKSKAMTLISHTSDAHANTFTKIFVVAYSRIHVEINRNFAMCVSHKTPEFFKLNRNGQISLLETLHNHVCENVAIACYVSLWHHQSILTCLQVESDNTLAYLAKNVSHYMHSNGSNISDILIDLNLENSGDTTINHKCSILNGLKFPDHLMFQVRGSDLVRYDYVDPNAKVEYEFWANSDVECCSKYQNQQAFVKHFKGAAQALKQNHLTPYSIICCFLEAFPLRTPCKSASVIAYQHTFWWSICKFPILLDLMFVGEGYTQYCETSSTLGYGLNHRAYWKRSKNDMTYSTGIVDNKSSCDCSSLETGNACLVIQDVNVVILHNLAALEENWLNWLVDLMHKGIALAIGVSDRTSFGMLSWIETTMTTI
ncbi:hypothetical protein MTR67_001487 [Solanum verrucosum]|uniref:Vacuolar sorting receptor thioredoxin-like domain-containing protein n=1 Tax=Solanum verrucosum TaxID=315347 RepID=A0AAF0PPC3_SOLVR|nr:hypothetical protein MTR67_001487 [Solanum verrucosum]